jgi:hypothetical protein
MPLILAIVADHHQAAELTALVKRLNVDLVHAAEVGEGLLALNDRVPDLVLTSPLMSPFDDGVLDEYLRGLGPAGAHVQSLRIPVLSTSTKKSKRGGFSLFGRAKDTHTLEGCDPKVFAGEITQYLVRAEEEKHNAQHQQALGGSGLPEAESPGDVWSTTPGPGAVVENEETWDPLAWQTDARSSQPEADSTAPLYSPIDGASEYGPVASGSAYSSSEREGTSSPIDSAADLGHVEDEAIPAVTDTTTQEVLQAAEAPAANVYLLPESPVETRTPSSLIQENVEPPVGEEHASLRDAVSSDPSADPDEPVAAAPLSLFAGVEASTDPASYLPSVEEPAVREPLTLFGGVDATTDPSEYLQTIAAEPAGADSIVADPAVTKPIAAAPIVVSLAPPLATDASPADVRSIEHVETDVPVSAEAFATPERNLVVAQVEARSAEVAPAPEAIAPPSTAVAVAPIPDPPATPPAPPASVAEKPKLSASFRSALAAIRKAWDAPLVAPAKAAPEELHAIAPREEAPAVEVIASVEPPAAFDVDLTGDVELIDREPLVEEMPEADVGRLEEPLGQTAEVYELRVEPDLQELESRLLAPLESSGAKPSSQEPVGRANETRSGEDRSAKDAPRGKREKSSKKGSKAASAKPRRPDKEPVQDEWGIFDPDRCGFAALVDKLEEVSEEKETTPRKGTKVRVISYN